MSDTLISDDQPIDPDDELLVAYLDGELSAEERSETEERLIDEPELRDKLQTLQRGWDILDELPDADPNEKMVESTMELVVADIDATQSGKRSAVGAIPRWALIGIFGSLVLGVTSFGLVVLAQRYQEQQLLSDLVIAENLDALLDANDLELMRQLKGDETWNQAIDFAIAMGRIRGESEMPLKDVAIDQRAQFVATDVSTTDRQRLSTRWDRFKRMPPEERDRLREVEQIVSQQTDAKALMTTMKRYTAWKAGLPADLVARIENPSGDSPTEMVATRKSAISEAIELSVERLAGGADVDDDTVELIIEILEWIVRLRIDDETSNAFEFQATLIERLPPSPQTEWFATRLLVGLLVRDPSLPLEQQLRRVPRPMRHLLPGEEMWPEPLTLGELIDIRDQLTTVPEWLELISSSDPELAARAFRGFLRTAVAQQFRFTAAEPTPLERLQDLPDREREVIELLPPKEAMNRLYRGGDSSSRRREGQRFRGPFPG